MPNLCFVILVVILSVLLSSEPKPKTTGTCFGKNVGWRNFLWIPQEVYSVRHFFAKLSGYKVSLTTESHLYFLGILHCKQFPEVLFFTTRVGLFLGGGGEGGRGAWSAVFLYRPPNWASFSDNEWTWEKHHYITVSGEEYGYRLKGCLSSVFTSPINIDCLK